LAGAGESRPRVWTGVRNTTGQAAPPQARLGPPGPKINPPGFARPDQGDHQRLWNLAPLMPDGKNYSRINQGRKELIDHVLVSAALVKPIDSITVEAVFPQPLPSITLDPNTPRDPPSSDHPPGIAAFAHP